MHYRVSGSGEVSILWIHGYTMDSHVWSYLWEKLPDYRHIGVDLIGHGLSRDFRTNDTLDVLIGDLKSVIDQEKPCIIIAISFGGIFAIEFVIRYPGLIKQLILNSPAIGGMQHDVATQDCNLKLIQMSKAQTLPVDLSKTWVEWPHDIFTGVKKHSEVWRPLKERILQHSWSEMKTGSMASILNVEHTPKKLSEIKIPVHVFLGEDDMLLFKRNAQILKKNMPDCLCSYLDGCGHLAFLENNTTSATVINQLI